MTRRKTHLEFVNEINIAFDNQIQVLGTYYSSEGKILVRDIRCKHEWEANIKHLLYRKQGCPYCKGKRISESKIKNLENYKTALKNKGINYIEVVSGYENRKSHIEVRNTKCNHIYIAEASNILQGSGCPICHGFKNTEKFQNQLDDRYPKEFKVLGKYVNNKTPISVEHLKCGRNFMAHPKGLLKNGMCCYCDKSCGEKYITRYLEENNYKFTPQYKIDECRNIKPLPFDFKVDIKNKFVLIEFDGSQHFGSSRYWGKDEEYSELIKLRDEIKTKFCEENNIPLLRIPYWWLRSDYKMKQALNKFLKEGSTTIPKGSTSK